MKRQTGAGVRNEPMGVGGLSWVKMCFKSINVELRFSLFQIYIYAVQEICFNPPPFQQFVSSPLPFTVARCNLCHNVGIGKA